jgi:amino acid transporter
MTSLLPLPGMIAQLGSRFVDPALGFAIGWNQWYNCAIAICSETSGAVILIQYWTDINASIPRNLTKIYLCNICYDAD